MALDAPELFLLFKCNIILFNFKTVLRFAIGIFKRASYLFQNYLKNIKESASASLLSDLTTIWLSR